MLMTARELGRDMKCWLSSFSRNFFPSSFIFNFLFRNNYVFTGNYKDSTEVTYTPHSVYPNGYLVDNNTISKLTLAQCRWVVITSADSCNYHCTRDTEPYHHDKDLLLSTFYHFESSIET